MRVWMVAGSIVIALWLVIVFAILKLGPVKQESMCICAGTSEKVLLDQKFLRQMVTDCNLSKSTFDNPLDYTKSDCCGFSHPDPFVGAYQPGQISKIYEAVTRGSPVSVGSIPHTCQYCSLATLEKICQKDSVCQKHLEELYNQSVLADMLDDYYLYEDSTGKLVLFQSRWE